MKCDRLQYRNIHYELRIVSICNPTIDQMKGDIHYCTHGCCGLSAVSQLLQQYVLLEGYQNA